MVSVWRAVAALSGIFVCVAVGAESIRRSSEAGTANDPHFSSLYQREAAGNGTRMAVTTSRYWRCEKGREALRAAKEIQLHLLTIVVITSIMPLSNREVDHDRHPQKPGTRTFQPRLARYLFYVFLCRLLRPQACAFSHAARLE